MVRPIVAPTVPEGTDRVRLCLHAANTVAEVRGLCLAIEEWLQSQLDGDSATRFEEMPQEPTVTPAKIGEAPISILSKL